MCAESCAKVANSAVSGARRAEHIDGEGYPALRLSGTDQAYVSRRSVLLVFLAKLQSL
jgi:hypothetical protein